MSTNFKTSPQNDTLKILNELKNYDGETIDLSNLNLFDATKAIILSSAYYFQKNPTKKIKYKVSTPNIQNILTDIPMSNMIEIS